MRHFIVLILCLFQGTASYANVALQEKSILINKQISAANLVPNVGVAVYDLERQKTVLGINETSLYTPASIQKIITAIYVLGKFNKSHQAKTRLYKGQDGVLYIEFGGDPKLTYAHLKNLLSPLHGQTFKKVVIVGARYQLPLLSPGWTISATQLCYGALASKSAVNMNRVVAYVTAGAIGKPAQIKIKDGQINYPIINHTVTKRLCYKDPSVGWMDQMQRDNIDMTRDGLVVKGCVPHDFKNFKLCLPIKPDDLDVYLKKTVHQAFKDLNITLKGSLDFSAKLPEGAQWIAEHKSPVVVDLVKESLKDSDNFITDSLFKAAVKVDETRFPANWVFAGKIVRRELNTLMGLNFDDKDLKIEDGSGLSLYNRVSCQAMAKLLAAMHKQDKGFYKLLPNAGADGTLADRLKNFKGKIWAKTGQLNGINTLAGYINGPKGPKYSFAIMVNGPTDQPSQNKSLIDRVLQVLGDVF